MRKVLGGFKRFRPQLPAWGRPFQRWLGNRKIGVKLRLGFVTVACLAGLIGVIGIWNVGTVNRNAQAIYEENMLPLGPIDKIAVAFQSIRVNIAYHIINTTGKDLYEYKIHDLEATIDSAMLELEKSRISNFEQGSLKTLREVLGKYRQAEVTVLEASRQNQTTTATELMLSTLQPFAEDVTQTVANIFQYNAVQAQIRSKASAKATESTTIYLIGLVVVGMLAAMGLGLILTRAIRRPMQQLTAAADRLAEGDLDIPFETPTQDEIGQLQAAFLKMVESSREQAIAAQQIAAGNLGVAVQIRSERDVLAQSLSGVITTLGELTHETRKLTTAAAAGQLSVRSDSSKFTGEYRELIEGVNATLDAVVKPLHVAAEYVARIGRGDIPAPIFDEYQGDFGELKESINACIEGLGALAASNRILQQIALNNLTEGVAGEYVGVYGEITAAINAVRHNLLNIQQVINQTADGDFCGLANLERGGQRCSEDQITTALILMMSNVQGLVHETLRLSQAAVEGDLDSRGEVDRFTGEYRMVVAGFNATLDAVVAPIAEAEAVLGRLAYNDYTLEMTGQYQGVLKRFAEQINLVRTRLVNVQDIFVRIAKGDISRLEEFKAIGQWSENDRLLPAAIGMMEAIQNLINETERLSTAATRGELTVRGDAGLFEGEYQVIITGLNNVMATIDAPLTEAATVLQKMAQGNLERAMRGDYQGQYARIKAALNHTLDSFNQVLSDIHRAAGQVASASRQVSDGSQNLSQGATEQAATLEELTASMMEVAAQTRENATRANQANELSEMTRTNALLGNEQMQEMLGAMTEIDRSASGIAKIIKVIDEIAFQTNILALNAAIEAARAGQYGKGFAVVAEEVRNLAARSAQAAQETTALIESSLKKVGDGAKIANETAAALSTIVDDIKQAANLVGEIAGASNEQATAIAQVNQGITQVSQVTQTTTATAEESAASSQELSSQAEVLRGLVGRFRLKGTVDEGVVPPAVIPTAAVPEVPERSRRLLDDPSFGKY